MDQDQHFMRRALELAQKGRGRTSPQPMAGAVVVQNGDIIGEGYFTHSGMPHAEANALTAAGSRADGGTLYLTSEPCLNHGRTGSCLERIVAAGISRVVLATPDPSLQQAGLAIKKLQDAGIEVKVGVEEEAALELNEVFIKYARTRHPFVCIKSAMSLDGKICTAFGDSKWVASEEANSYVHQLRATYDAVLIGVNTIFQDNPQLSSKAQGARAPLRVIVDSQARTPLDSKVFLRPDQDSWRNHHTLVVVSEQAPDERIRSLQEAGCEVLVCSEEGPTLHPRVDLRRLMNLLGKRGITSVLVEGGGILNAAMIEAGAVDKMLLFIAPKLVGGEKALTPMEGEGITVMDQALPVYRWRWSPIGGDMMVEGYLHPVN